MTHLRPGRRPLVPDPPCRKRRKVHTALAAILAMSTPALGADAPIPGNTRVESFSDAKKALARQVFPDHRITFYCGSDFDEKGNLDHSRSGYEPQKDWKRAWRLEWEHVVPAHAFGQAFPEWRDGHPECVDKRGPFKGRNCAAKVNTAFRLMEADMYNLQPAIGEVNALRSNYSYAIIPGEERAFGACDIEIADGKAEPAPHIRGDIARTYWYMERAYPGRGIVSDKNYKLYAAWDREDPVDAWECQRVRRIEAIQGNEQPYVKYACQQAGMW